MRHFCVTYVMCCWGFGGWWLLLQYSFLETAGGRCHPSNGHLLELCLPSPCLAHPGGTSLTFSLRLGRWADWLLAFWAYVVLISGCHTLSMLEFPWNLAVLLGKLRQCGIASSLFMLDGLWGQWLFSNMVPSLLHWWCSVCIAFCWQKCDLMLQHRVFLPCKKQVPPMKLQPMKQPKSYSKWNGAGMETLIVPWCHAMCSTLLDATGGEKDTWVWSPAPSSGHMPPITSTSSLTETHFFIFQMLHIHHVTAVDIKTCTQGEHGAVKYLKCKWRKSSWMYLDVLDLSVPTYYKKLKQTWYIFLKKWSSSDARQVF